MFNLVDPVDIFYLLYRDPHVPIWVPFLQAILMLKSWLQGHPKLMSKVKLFERALIFTKSSFFGGVLGWEIPWGTLKSLLLPLCEIFWNALTQQKLLHNTPAICHLHIYYLCQSVYCTYFLSRCESVLSFVHILPNESVECEWTIEKRIKTSRSRKKNRK